MEENLILNNGTELAGHLLETETRLFVYVYGTTLGALFPLLNDPEVTEKIEWNRYGTTGTVSGYRKLKSISDEGNGLISASLVK